MRIKIRTIILLFVFSFVFNQNIAFAKECKTDANCPASEYCSVNLQQCSPRLSENNLCGRPEMCKSGNCVDGLCRPADFVSNGTSVGGVSLAALYDSSDCDGKCPAAYKCKSVGYVSDAGATRREQYQCVEKEVGAISTASTCLKMSFGLPFTGMKRDDCVSYDTGVGNLTKYLIQFIFASIGTISVIILIIAGFMIAFATGNVNTIKKAKEMIKNVSIGLVFAIFSGSILAIINPDLVNISVFNVAPPRNIEVVAKSTVEKLLNKTNMPDGLEDPRMKEIINRIATSYNADYCILYTFAKIESGGRIYAIGHDERFSGNTTGGTTGSGRAFCSYKEYFSGKKFATEELNKCGSNSQIVNDDLVNKSDSKNLGLDWRFSHGIGMMQITIFPNSKDQFELSPAGVKSPATPYTKTINGVSYSAVSLFDPEVSLKAAVELLKSKGFNDITNSKTVPIKSDRLKEMFKKYNGSGEMAEKYAQQAIIQYDDCRLRRVE